MDISVVIPLYNEDESLTELESWIRKVMEANGYSYEIVFIDDGSRDQSWFLVGKRNATTQLLKQFLLNFIMRLLAGLAVFNSMILTVD